MPAALMGDQVRQSQEFQSSLVRLVMWFVMAGILGAGGATGYYDLDWPLYWFLFAIHFVWFAGLLAWCVRRPALIPGRTYLAVAADLSATTLVIYLAGDILEPFFLVYILSFLSQGTRFGATNLAIASVGSVVCYSALALVMGGWWQQPLEVSFIVAALIVLPLYQHALLRSLNAARRNAEVAKQARGNFLATMTHELRTPLSGVIGMSRLLDTTDLDADQRKYVSSLCSSADTLQALIGDILDLSKVDADALDLAQDRFDLREAILDVVHNLAGAALEKGVEPVCCIETSLPEFVTGDRVRVQQVLYNLVGNAVKFTPSGHVSVEAHRLAADEYIDEPHLEIAINDTGIGIPADRLECIFDSFWQADTSTSRQYPGTGLGTTIAARLVEAMGGRIDVDSREGEGSVFRVRLPLFGGDAAADAPPAPPEALRGRTALLFETGTAAMDALREACRRAGMHTLECAGEDDIDALAPAAPVDLVLVADAPGALGLPAIADRLRRRCGGDPPVIYLQYRGRIARPAPAGARVHKPFHPASLQRAMAAALEGSAVDDRERRRPACTAGAACGPRRILVVEDDETNADMICILLRSWGHRVELARDASEALATCGRQRFDLLLLDVRMPGMDGTELAREIRRRETGGTRVPIVALTANAAEETRSSSLAAGMDEFLSKPVDPQALDALLQVLGGRSDPLSPPAAVATTTTTTTGR